MELVKSISIANLVSQRNAFVERVRAAAGLVSEAKEVFLASGFRSEARDAAVSDAEFHSLVNFNSGLHGDQLFTMLVSGYDAMAWNHLMHESGMLSLMSSKDVEDWHKKIRERDVPELTMASIEATFSELHARRKDMLGDGIEQLFRALSWEHKTNSPVAFGKKVVLEGGHWSMDQTNKKHVDDAIRFMHVVDGKPQPDHRDNFAFKTSQIIDASKFESEYVAVNGFKNGNIHVIFKRPDLVAKMNAILASRYPTAIAKPKAA